jgi:predicted DNA-binding transcriptional regulator AlpA
MQQANSGFICFGPNYLIAMFFLENQRPASDLPSPAAVNPPNSQAMPLATSPCDEACWLLTLGDLARQLQRSRRAIERDMQLGRIGPKPIRLGRAVRFSASEVKAWIAASCPRRDEWRRLQSKTGKR